GSGRRCRLAGAAPGERAGVPAWPHRRPGRGAGHHRPELPGAGLRRRRGLARHGPADAHHPPAAGPSRGRHRGLHGRVPGTGEARTARLARRGERTMRPGIALLKPGLLLSAVLGTLLAAGRAEAHRLEADYTVLPGRKVQVESWFDITGDPA